MALDFFIRIRARDETASAARSAARNLGQVQRAAGGQRRGSDGRFVGGGGRRSRRGGMFGFAADAELAAQNMERFGQRAASAIAAPLKAFSDLEDGVDAAVSKFGLAPEEAEKARARIEKLARTVGTDISGADALQGAGAALFFGQAGFSVEDTEKAVPVTAKLSKATKTGLAETADITSNIMSGFKKGAEEVGNVANVLTKTTNTSNTDLRQLGEALSYAAPSMNTLGVSLEETSAIVGLLSDAGIQGSRAGTAVRALARGLDPRGKKGRKALARLGIRKKDRETDGRFDPAKMVQRFAEQSQKKGLSQVGQFKALKRAFGEEGSVGMSVLLAAEIGADNLDEDARADLEKQGIDITKIAGKSLANYTAKIRDSAGFLDQTYGQMTNNTKTRAEELKAQWFDTMVSVGEGIAPLANEILPELKKGARELGEFAEKHPEAVKGLVKFVAVVGGIGLVGGPVVRGLGTISSVVSLIGAGAPAARATVGQFVRLNAELGGMPGKIGGMAGKLGLAATAIASLAWGASEFVKTARAWRDFQNNKRDFEANEQSGKAFAETTLRSSLAGLSPEELRSRMDAAGGPAFSVGGLETDAERLARQHGFGGIASAPAVTAGLGRREALKELWDQGGATDAERAELISGVTQQLAQKLGATQERSEAMVREALKQAKLDIEVKVRKDGRIVVGASSPDANVSTEQQLDTGAMVEG